ncbi:MAG TPA: hypothetical protein VEA59_02235 [Patescibacteria group bacterium]|nr:hypothetical protein [Patescibacteria group bacterium]
MTLKNLFGYSVASAIFITFVIIGSAASTGHVFAVANTVTKPKQVPAYGYTQPGYGYTQPAPAPVPPTPPSYGYMVPPSYGYTQPTPQPQPTPTPPSYGYTQPKPTNVKQAPQPKPVTGVLQMRRARP